MDAHTGNESDLGKPQANYLIVYSHQDLHKPGKLHRDFSDMSLITKNNYST